MHESVMVEHDPGHSDIPAVLNGAWWGVGSREARVMVSNTSTSSQTADVYLDFQGRRHALPNPVTFLPYETKTLEISDLYALLSPLTGTSHDDLINQIDTVTANWNSSQASILASSQSAVEAEAYQVSDPLAPQYKYQSTCGARGL